jgi:nicotinamide-nucleotide amidase
MEEKLRMLYNLIMLNDIKDFLKAGKQTLSVAESVTSGHLQAAFSAADEASFFFQGGITTYNIGQKARHLKIEPIYAEQCNCISPEVSIQMALQCQKMFSSNYSIGITGYASPLPEKRIFELFAFYAISLDGTIKDSGKIISEKSEPVDVQVDYSNQVIEAFFKVLHNKK